MKVSLFRKEHFNAAHRLFNPSWKDDKNKKIFGKCSNPNFHGHNYELFVQLIGEINPETGYVYDMKKLSNLIKEKVTNRFDHKNLNLDVPEFKNLNPTVENIAVVIYNILRPEIEKSIQMKIRLFETKKNYVEYPA